MMDQVNIFYFRIINYYLNLFIKQGAIGIEELEDPLISLGIAESRKDVSKIIASVDEDGTGAIEFAEFL